MEINVEKESSIHLLVPAAQSSPSSTPNSPDPVKSTWIPQIFLKFKGVFLILLWNVMVGVIYGLLLCVAIAVAVNKSKYSFKVAVYICIGIFASISLGQMFFYPLGGLLADIKYGRYKVITFSQVQITLSFILLVIGGVLIEEGSHDFIAAIVATISGIFLLIGFSGFQSNAVQFGLDQLLDAPSNNLSLFLWWYVWSTNLGELLARVTGTIYVCYTQLKNTL